ncbi:hypothetical protein [Marilutibacter spongiae]|uniref:Uncharacterized protein n=1 Tax=Marilutibacter spongiae TaxID=2025720 RepID=A0A7W3Y5V8_9GAMM|nr:hypothetical protein [Lysobacter spongiae]MBB1060390.1 hypothetical protein [Lysobacter spongiae]
MRHATEVLPPLEPEFLNADQRDEIHAAILVNNRGLTIEEATAELNLRAELASAAQADAELGQVLKGLDS